MRCICGSGSLSSYQQVSSLAGRSIVCSWRIRITVQSLSRLEYFSPARVFEFDVHLIGSSLLHTAEHQSVTGFRLLYRHPVLRGTTAFCMAQQVYAHPDIEYFSGKLQNENRRESVDVSPSVSPRSGGRLSELCLSFEVCIWNGYRSVQNT